MSVVWAQIGGPKLRLGLTAKWSLTTRQTKGKIAEWPFLAGWCEGLRVGRRGLYQADVDGGALEALTFYHKNGTNVDLSSIPQPLLTNITGQNFVGVAPVSTANDDEKQFNWAAEKPGTIYSAKGNVRSPRGTEDDNDETETTTDYDSNEYLKPPQVPDGNDKHFLGPWIERTLRKRGTKEETDTEKFIKVVDGNAVIPQGAGIQSVALPPLLSLNNNFSDIPVPIPNTSIIHYARVNTLIKSANSTS